MTISLGGVGIPGLGPFGSDKSAERAPRGVADGERVTRSWEARPERDVAEAVRGRPPKDADPRLWALLTRAERDFYFRNVTFEGLTYGPGAHAHGSDAAGRRLGGHVDLRV